MMRIRMDTSHMPGRGCRVACARDRRNLKNQFRRAAGADSGHFTTTTRCPPYHRTSPTASPTAAANAIRHPRRYQDTLTTTLQAIASLRPIVDAIDLTFSHPIIALHTPPPPSASPSTVTIRRRHLSAAGSSPPPPSPTPGPLSSALRHVPSSPRCTSTKLQLQLPHPAHCPPDPPRRPEPAAPATADRLRRVGWIQLGLAGASRQSSADPNLEGLRELPR